jgi:hypothetical protein
MLDICSHANLVIEGYADVSVLEPLKERVVSAYHGDVEVLPGDFFLFSA